MMAGWIVGLGAGLAWEVWALVRDRDQTLSRSFWRMRDGKHGWLVAAVWAGATWHLFVEGRNR